MFSATVVSSTRLILFRELFLILTMISNFRGMIFATACITRVSCTYPAYERDPPLAIYYAARCLVQFMYDYADVPELRPRTEALATRVK